MTKKKMMIILIKSLQLGNHKMQNNQLKQLIDTSSRIILKVGSSLLINENNNDINYHWLKNFSKEIQSLTDKKTDYDSFFRVCCIRKKTVKFS